MSRLRRHTPAKAPWPVCAFVTQGAQGFTARHGLQQHIQRMKSSNRANAFQFLSKNKPVSLSRAVAASAVAGSLLLFAAGCSKDDAAQQGGGERPPTEVGVVTVKEAPLTLNRSLPGRTSPFRVAEVRARVNGIVQERLFEEGSDVKQGDVLYRIDPAPYEATLESAKASLARAEANLSAAEAQAKRYKELVERRAVSQQEYDDVQASVGVYKADVAAAKAAMRSAEIDLGYTNVTAPVSGKIGRSEVTEGAYVQGTAATLLATIRQIDPMYVDVTQSTEQLMRLRQDLDSGRLQKSGKDEVEVTLLLETGEYPVKGKLQFTEVNVDESTSSVTLRALFDNKDGILLPGMFVRAVVPEAEQADAVLVPQRGVSRDTRGNPTALVVGAGDVVELRQLELDRSVGNEWLVRSGLKDGDRLIVEGVQKVRPGVKAKAVASEKGDKNSNGTEGASAAKKN